MENRRTIALGGINWTWYLQGEFNDDALTVKILFHTRWHNERDLNHPKVEHTHQAAQIREDADRNAIAVVVGSVRYNVINVLNVFDYNDFTHLVREIAE